MPEQPILAEPRPAQGPRLALDPDLPITAWADEISAQIADHQVVIVAGETGSGKTTQLPKICLQLGRSRIGHTQPRRIAARSVAERIAEEIGTDLGDLVGYQVRFTRKASRDTQLKVMTDGVLLAEISHDRDLRRYDTIIIDEAHERSLNIDFLLGYLKQLLPRRPDLKVIVTSATIDTARFSAHFGDAPVIEVSGRTYPVEIRYEPVRDDSAEGEKRAQTVAVDAERRGERHDPERDQIDAICDAVVELQRDIDGDILVFCSGEREIRDTADALNALELRFTEVLPLYARLSAAEQHRVFARHTGRRVVLATNVAETSLTVPGIRAVIDPGTARISRYSARTKVQRLPIEPVSQASANQRAGRCGRVAPGICIRLYSEADFDARPEFTEPEILRTNLASVILQMTQAGLGSIADFPFVEAPDAGQIADGLRLLDELGALSPKSTRERPRLTRVGHQLARVPLDPRLARMLIAADRLGCLREVTVIVAALAIQDVRERPAEHRDAADALHRRFHAPMPTTDDDQPTPDGSDFIAIHRLWEYLRERRAELSGNAFRRMCRDEYLNFLRVREWQDLVTQLRDIAKDLQLTRNSTPASHDRIHTALLTGLLSHLGLAEVADEPRQRGRRRGRAPLKEYLGARGTRFAISPGSSLSRTQPPLVMAAEIVETTRLWARTVAAIDASWVEQVAGHLLKRSYSEPHWSATAGSVSAYERVTLYGVPIIAQRRVNYGRIDPAVAREIFIRSALVEGQWHTRHHFHARNVATRRRAEELEERSRRRDIVVDDDAIFAFYDARVPADIVSVAHFDSWWRKARHETPDLLDLSMDDLVVDDAEVADGRDFPDHWPVAGHDLAVDYVFDPGSRHDGVTVRVPLAVLNQIPAAPFSWQVPGLRRELATELLRGLPKAERTRFVPAPDHAGRALNWLDQHPEPGETLSEALARALRQLTGEQATGWRPDAVPEHVRVTFEVVSDGTVVARGKDLDELRPRVAPKLRESLSAASADLTRSGATDWVFDSIADELSVRRGGHQVVAFPGLVDERVSVGLNVADTRAARDTAHADGLRRLVQLTTPDPTKWVVSHLSNPDKIALGTSVYPSVPALLADARLAAVGDLIGRATDPGSVRDQAAFARLRDVVRADLPDRTRELVALVADICRRDQELQRALLTVRDEDLRADVAEQRANLMFDGFIRATPPAHLARLPVYLRAATTRLDTPPSARERQGREVIAELEDEYAELVAAVPPGRLPTPVDEIGWLLEELRVSLFAQSLGTRVPVSAKRVRKAIADARAAL